MGGLLYSLLIGLLAGYLGSLLLKGSGQGLLLNLIFGLIGGLLGGYLFLQLGIGGQNILWQLISATVGAVILIWITSLIFKKKK